MNADANSGYDTTLSDSEVLVTETARGELARLLAQEDDDEIRAIRIYVGGGGCAGMNYGMAFTGEPTPYDKVLAADGLDLYVDAVALSFLDGVEIDYVSDDTGARFVFKNAFQTTGGSGMCGGCGMAGH